MAEHVSTSAFDELDPATLAVRDLGAVNRQLVAEIARSAGLGVNDMEALGELVQHGRLGAADLASRLGIRSASATVLIDRLEQAGHVERVRDTDDRRRVTVVATESAKQAAYESWGPVVTAMDEVSQGLSERDREVVVRFLERVTRTAESFRQQAAAQRPVRARDRLTPTVDDR